MPPQTHPKISLQPSPQTLPATRTLVNVHNDAFANDPWLELMYGPPDDDADYFAADMLDIMCGDPTARFMQAVVRSATSETDPNSETQTAAEKETETVVGWSWWNIYPSRSTYLGAAKQDKERAKKPPSTAISPAAYLDYKADVVDRREKWIENREGEGEGGVAILQVLVVQPEYQNQGIGSQLIKHGLEEVRALGVPAWVEATDDGYRVYERSGFRDVQGDIVIDMTKYGREEVQKGICMMFRP